MRPWALIVLPLTFCACQCGSNAAVPVTLRFRNTTPSPLFLDDSSGDLGLEVQLSSNGSYQTFSEAPVCTCQLCQNICSASSGCSCPDAGNPNPALIEVPPGASVERVYGGKVPQPSAAGCGAIVSAVPCVQMTSDSAAGTLQLQSCYAPAPSYSFEIPDAGTDGGVGDAGFIGPFPGTLQQPGLTCVTKRFTATAGVVEVTPPIPTPCSSNSQCVDAGELCLDGACTSGCPANGFPSLSATSPIAVPLPDSTGFFSSTARGTETVLTGTGVVTSASYSNGNTVLHLHQAADAGNGSATVYLTLPPADAVAFNLGETLTVEVVDDSAVTPEARALVIWDVTKNLVLAADTAYGGYLLRSTDTAPFTVSAAGNIIGCEFDPACGKVLYQATVFTGATPTATLDPGRSAQVSTSVFNYTVVNLQNGQAQAGQCALSLVQPYAILAQRPPGVL